MILNQTLENVASLGILTIHLGDVLIQKQLRQKHRMLYLVLFHLFVDLLILLNLFVQQYCYFVKLNI